MPILAGYAPHMGVFKTLVLTRKNPFKTRKRPVSGLLYVERLRYFLYISSAYTNALFKIQNKKLKILLKLPVVQFSWEKI